MPPGPPKPQPRIIPACAGNTEAAVDDEIVSRDHPRVCGEHAEHDPIVSAVRGSSPRVRGTRQARQKPDRPAGIIPACAGNTGQIMTAIGSVGDHPRVCGEHPVQRRRKHHQRGSSPRVRGTRRFDSTIDRPLRDHPRVCGEHPLVRTRICHRPGSSPRVRGTQVAQAKNIRTAGIIPACAGNTRAVFVWVDIAGDHPRVCGEHFDHKGETLPAQGSSPRVRGTRARTRRRSR